MTSVQVNGDNYEIVTEGTENHADLQAWKAIYLDMSTTQLKGSSLAIELWQDYEGWRVAPYIPEGEITANLVDVLIERLQLAKTIAVELNRMEVK